MQRNYLQFICFDVSLNFGLSSGQNLYQKNMKPCLSMILTNNIMLYELANKILPEINQLEFT